jgi:hypothetical protein
MDNPIELFKTSKGQADYFAAYEAALELWPVPHETRFVATTYGETHVFSCGRKMAFQCCCMPDRRVQRCGSLI